MSTLKQHITTDMKTALRERHTVRLGAIRLLQAAIKQKEVDERIELSDAQILAILDKMLKQRRDSIAQFEAAGRQDLADIEKQEIAVLAAYMPQAARAEEIEATIVAALTAHGSTAASLGKIMTEVKGKLAGRADLAQVSMQIKARLT